MDIKHLQKQLAVADDRVTAKANELLRLAAVKVPQATLRQVNVELPHGAPCPGIMAAVPPVIWSWSPAYAKPTLLVFLQCFDALVQHCAGRGGAFSHLL
jgi:hypothetical protein